MLRKKDREKDYRFVITNARPGLSVVVDKETGVNYLLYSWPDVGGGLTPLLNPDGTPIVTHFRDTEE